MQRQFYEHMPFLTGDAFLGEMLDGLLFPSEKFRKIQSLEASDHDVHVQDWEALGRDMRVSIRIVREGSDPRAVQLKLFNTQPEASEAAHREAARMVNNAKVASAQSRTSRRKRIKKSKRVRA